MTATIAAYAAMASILAASMWRSREWAIGASLALCFAATAITGEITHGIDMDVAAISADFALVYAMRFAASGPRAYAVGLVSLTVIGLRVWFIASYPQGFEMAPIVTQYTYATAINCAFVLQALICGGWADGIGMRVADWLDRVWPRGARVLRNVAG